MFCPYIADRPSIGNARDSAAIIQIERRSAWNERAGVPCNSHGKIVYMWCLSPSSLLVYDDISHRAFRSLRDQLMISLSLRLWLMRILIEIAFWNLRKARPQSVTAATYKCRLDGKTRDGTRENNLDSFYNGPGFYASRVGFASSQSSFYAVAPHRGSLVRVLLKAPPHMHRKATKEKHGGARVAAARNSL